MWYTTIVFFGNGSPPRTWGRQRSRQPLTLRIWFTPTHVGKTSTRLCIRPLPLVHPHARGEDVRGSAPKAGVSGSPPRTWGRLFRRWYQRLSCRFTPTHVGKTSPGSFSHACHMVHPHARGEDHSWSYSLIFGSGSPPRTWGRLNVFPCAARIARFTPTHVGKTTPLGY